MADEKDTPAQVQEPSLTVTNTDISPHSHPTHLAILDKVARERDAKAAADSTAQNRSLR